ncbi:MAG: sodium:proton antiporter [Xanthomonadales bacterium]|nr:sodium:proton antiporter [Xanthomonadales bacterium]
METTLFLALVLLLGFACQWLAWRVQLPAILFLLGFGILFGPVFGWIDPDRLMGDLLFPFVSLGVAVILFEGSLTLRFEETRGIQAVIRNLVTVGILITWLSLAAAGHFIADLPWSLALLFGALVSVTGPTVIVPLLRTVRPTSRIANILRWEGILIDPIGAILAVLVFDAIVSGQQSEPIIAFGLLILVGVVSGGIGAIALAFLLRRHLVPEYLQSYAALALMLVVFAVSNHLEHESGLLAVTVMGVFLANTPDLHVEDILDFKEHLTVLLLSILFILLGARVDLGVMGELGWICVMLLLIAKFIVRPVAVFFSCIGTKITLREGLLLAWIGPRGIVAAAVAALFALKLVEYGTPGAERLVPLVFAIIIGTVVIESATTRTLARWLGLSAADDQGVLIVGADRVGMGIAQALKALDFPVLIADTDYDKIRKARMQGFRTYYGSVLSEHADRLLDLTGMTRLFAVTKNSELNTLICSRYKPEFGIQHTFLLLPKKEKDQQEQHRELAVALRVPVLFGEQVSWTQLASLLSKGAQSRTTKLTEDFGLEEYRSQHGTDAVLMFAVTPEGRLKVFNNNDKIEPGPGWTLCSLVMPEDPKPEVEREPESPRPLPADNPDPA